MWPGDQQKGKRKTTMQRPSQEISASGKISEMAACAVMQQHNAVNFNIIFGLGNDSVTTATGRNPSDGSMRRNQKRFIQTWRRTLMWQHVATTQHHTMTPQLRGCHGVPIQIKQPRDRLQGLN